ncbi:hypothetical protein [Nocardia jiangsuensis]|uniref:Transposase n=1 Tax=Nocardia jiangsuensis TaxID=1691563 RepID=A0ABV8DSP2_9NOCA
MLRRYPEEFRRKVLDLVAAGRPVAQVAVDSGIGDRSELTAAGRRIHWAARDLGVGFGVNPDVVAAGCS